MFPEHHLMLHFSPQFVDFEIVSGEVSSKTTFLRVMGTDRKSKHLCSSQRGLRPRTMFIEIRAVTRVLRRGRSASPLYVTSLLIADIWVSLTRTRALQIEVDWQRGQHLRSDLIQYRGEALWFHLILHYLIIEQQRAAFCEMLNKSQNIDV